MRTGHLFAGAGGGLLADLILGHEPMWAVESDPYACAVLRERFPGFPGLSVIEGDVRGVDFRQLAGVDAICAGFPCQDISAAGNGAGLDGARSGLFFEVMRAVDDIRPTWVFLENSPRIRTRGRDRITAELVARGYGWRDGILAAADVGAPHQRDRWWLLANANGHHGQAGRGINGRRCEQGQAVAACGGDDVADATGQRLEEPQPGQAGHEQPPATGTDRSIGWWAAEPGMGRMAHRVANRPHRIKCLGNGQVPLCAALAWRLLGGP